MKFMGKSKQIFYATAQPVPSEARNLLSSWQ